MEEGEDLASNPNGFGKPIRVYAWPYTSTTGTATVGSYKPISLLIRNPSTLVSVSIKVYAYKTMAAAYNMPFGDALIGEWLFDRKFDTTNAVSTSNGNTESILEHYTDVALTIKGNLWADSLYYKIPFTSVAI